MDLSFGPSRVVPPLDITTLDRFPNGTVIVPPFAESTYIKAWGMWYPPVAYTIGFDQFSDGSLALLPYCKTTYVKYAKLGRWLLANTSPEHFLTGGEQRRPNFGNVITEFASSRQLDTGIVHTQNQEACLVQPEDASEAHTVIFNVSLTDAKLGRFASPDSPAFTGEFAEHQKAYLSYEIDQLNLHRQQINIRAPKRGPYNRAKVARLLAGAIERAWSMAKARGEPLLYDGAEVELAQVILQNVRRISQGGVRVVLGFAPRRM